jgi:septal ring factor EnvC (AmiA/AmiB activator)
MLWLRVLPFLFPLAFEVVAAPPSPSKMKSKGTTQEQLIAIAATIQNHEFQLSAIEHELNQARTEESAILSELQHYNQRLMETVHYLRHAVQYSPLLAMLSAPKPENVIHSSMLLRSITPEIHARNQQLFEKVTSLSQIRAQLEEKQNKLRDITFQYHQNHDNLNELLKTRSKTSISLKKQPEGFSEILNLIPPVVGELVPTYGNTNPEWAPFTQGVLFTTRNGAQVTSPLSGIVASAGDYENGQGKMLIIETQNSHIVMSGLGSLNCTVGQNVIAGEPVGRMPPKPSKKTKSSPQSPPQLYLEVWHQEQTVDPQSVLNEKRKDL